MKRTVPDDDIEAGVVNQVFTVDQIRTPDGIGGKFVIKGEKMFKPQVVGILRNQKQQPQLTGPCRLQGQSHYAESMVS